MGCIEDVGARIGMALTLMTAGVVSGAPISGAILDGTGSFEDVGYYGGACVPVYTFRPSPGGDGR